MSHARNRSSQQPPSLTRQQEAMQARSANAAESRQNNLMANTADARIRGHALNSQRISQAIRDGKSPQKSARSRSLRGK